MPVEVVVVGDAPRRPSGWPLVLAAREAMVNAARHSGAGRVDVYAEVTATGPEVFVRDRGAGFDPDAVPRTGSVSAIRSSAGCGGTAAPPTIRTRARPGHRGAPADATAPPPRDGPDRPTPASPQEHRARVVVVDDHAMFRTGVKAELGDPDRIEVRRRGRGRRRGRRRGRCGCSRRWCCSTCTCPAAAARR